MTDAPLNPFTPQTVSSLHQIEPPIRWLNDAALRKLTAIFETVEERPHRCELVQPVLSRGDGYGKSHLLGRLVRELDGRATCVSVADYHDPLTCWVTLLQSILDALSQPESIHHLPYPPTPLDELAHQVLGFLAVMLADKGMADTPIPGGSRDDILENAFEKWDLSDPASALGTWVNETLTACEQDATREAVLVRLLKAATLHPYSDDAAAMNWLLVLHRYARDRADEESRQMCLGWMLTSQLEVPVEVFLLNEERLESNNLVARQQTLDLLALAKLFRPFLLCFDQTSSLTTGLAKSFGRMLAELVRAEGAHFSIVTANSNLWESTVLPEFTPESLACLAAKMELVGLTREQGRSLAEQRLQRNGDPVELQERFLNKKWLEEQFAQGSLGQRDFLRRCELRYQELVPHAIRASGETEEPEAEAPPAEATISDQVPAVPAPDFNVAAAPVPAPSPGTATVIAETLPPLPEIQLPDREEKIEPVVEPPTGSPPASDEVAQSSPVLESPAPVEVIDTVRDSNVVPAETALQHQGSADAIAEPPAAVGPACTPELLDLGNQLPEQQKEEAPVAPESPAPTEPPPDLSPAPAPEIVIPEAKSEAHGESDLPVKLLPPAKEGSSIEPIELPETETPENIEAPLQESPDSFNEPETAPTGIAPVAMVASAVAEEPPTAAPADTAADVAPSAPQEIPVTTPIDGDVGSEPAMEPSPDFANEAPTEIQSAPLIEEIKPAEPGPLVADESPMDSFPAEAAPSAMEPEPQIYEPAPDVAAAFAEIPPEEPLDLPPASEVAIPTEDIAALDEVPSPVMDDVGSAASEAVPDASITIANDQALLTEALLQIINAHRFASYGAIADELRRKMQRSVPVEEAMLCAQSTSEIHVYSEGPNVAFLWQGAE